MWPALAADVGVRRGESDGTSFITGATGEIVAELQQEDGAWVAADIDTDANTAMRASWGLFRDRRPSLYAPLMQLGATNAATRPGRL